MTEQLIFNITPEYKELHIAAHDMIEEVMNAGGRRRIAEGRDPNEWQNLPIHEHIRHSFHHVMHCMERYDILDNESQTEEFKNAMLRLLFVHVLDRRLHEPALDIGKIYAPEKLEECVEE
jgi:hypothetical protein